MKAATALWSAIAFFVGMTGAVAESPQESKVAFDLPAQPLSNALNALAVQSNLHIVFHTEDAKGLQAQEVTGSYTPSEALKILLARTDLSYEFVDDRTVEIRAEKRASGQPSVGIGERTEGTVRVAQAEASSSASPSREEGAGEVQGSASNDKENGDEVLEEVVVTAQKRLERLQDVPIAISVLSGDDLDTSTIQGLTETLRSVPGVTALVAAQGGGTQLAIRGVTAASAIGTGSSPIAYYLDGVPFGLVKTASLPDINIYDLERVEVLRGPQGTLYGASALNGVVRVLTHDANPNDFELKGRAWASSTEHGGENYRGDVAVNVPIVEGKLAARAALSYQDSSGWIDRPNNSDANSAENRNFRLKMNAKPNDDLSIMGSAWLSRADYGSPSFSPDNRQIPVLVDEPISFDYDIFGLSVAYDFSAFSVSSATSYVDYFNHTLYQFTGIDLQEIILASRVFSQEVNLQSAVMGGWRWSLGAMYRDGQDRTFSHIPTFPILEVVEESTSHAIYGELTRLFADGRWELTGGLRYFEDRLKSTEISSPLGVAPAGLYDRPEFDAVTPRAVLNWHPTEHVTVYGSYSEGFRSGYSQGQSVVALFPPIEPDTLHNYEIGLKGSLWSGRVDLDTAVFYTDWTDVQQSLGVPIGNSNPPNFVNAGINSGSASGMGVELGANVSLTDHLTMSGSFGWNDLTFDSDVLSRGIPLFSKGGRINYSPERTANASVNYEFPLGGYKGHFGTSANYVSELQARRLVGAAIATSIGDSMLVARASFSVEAPAGWTATLFADNIFNEENAFLNDNLGNVNRDIRTRPRTIGVQVEFGF
jgi:iron complex outermembrane recepter protein